MKIIKGSYQSKTLPKEIKSNKIPLKISNEARELVESAELLSKKRKKHRITSILKEKGE